MIQPRCGYPAVAALLFLVACEGSQTSAPRPVFSAADVGAGAALTDYAETGPPTGTASAPKTADVGPTSVGGLTFFTSRAAFENEAPNLPLEDFEEGNVPPGGVKACPAPEDANSNNDCFTPGQIQPGVQFTVTQFEGPGGLALLGPGFASAPSRNIVANVFVDNFIVKFTNPNVTAAGMDLVAYFGADVCQIDVFGANGSLGSTTAPCTNAGSFWGVVSGEPIRQIRITSPNGQAEGADNVEFGEASTVVVVAIDIKPGSAENPINLGSNGLTPVAVFTTRTAAGDARDFDATQIDAASLAFGPGGAAEAHGMIHVEDVDGDGDLDVVVHFTTNQSGIACGDTRATLVGRLANGRRFKGTDVVTPKCLL